MSNLDRDIAITTAFLYAGALQKANELENASLKDRGIAIDLWDDWQGHTGFVQTCTEYAQAIETWVTAHGPQNYPGVYAYELIEPLGAWLIIHESPLPDTATVLQEFQRRYLEWIADTDEHGIKPTDRVVAHDGAGIQEIHQLETCEDCGARVSSIIGCPDGAHICQGCFDAGNH